jgi:hypothetical protein
MCQGLMSHLRLRGKIYIRIEADKYAKQAEPDDTHLPKLAGTQCFGILCFERDSSTLCIVRIT